MDSDYIMVRDAPSPTVEQLGRELGCCPYCLGETDLPETKTLPFNIPLGTKQIADLNIGDAIDCSYKNRNRLGNVARAYDLLNGTKHEMFMLTETTARCWRYK